MHNKTRTYSLLAFILIMTLPFIPATNGAETKKTTTQSTLTDNQKTEFTIQTLLNNAEPGTTIHLPSGTFQEILTITKPLTIIGNTTNQTMLAPTSAPNGYALHITAEDVTLNNLQITNHATGLYTTAVKISASHCIITNCTFTHTPIGIALWSSQNQISHSLFDNCSDEGIVLLGTPTNPCSNNTITTSIFTNNCDGIELQHATYNHITTCHFTSNTHAGIDAIESDNNHNTITHCTFTDNAAFGIYLARSTQNLITHCSFTTDTLTLVQSPENTLIKTQVHDIQLLEESSLILDQCNETTGEKIISEHSSCEIRTPQDHSYQGEKRIIARYHLILISLLSYLKTLKTFADQLTKARM